ncbi:carboxymuconolactone decarboxylase family protein [Iodobacter fluviatilis]|uniref:Alkylhydroperoxidase family enzyme n=1 Tax=Iodobacter fluviatilis TaxID=537 RepID=A0A377Q674_9NEIS|nr:carboxymuconolactone decarboxylase family protein [Iodobacter fluviatilis]TCU89406.1 alkylhydroperoxidase family enzyme [Iodobacter fluviatilis]STQ90776.1 uncharacterized peroxidase-related enzyme [Iodobacter fluviatilis]
MTQFISHSITSAPAASQPLLSHAQANFGFVPNLFAHMASAPVLLEGYLTLTGIFNKSSMTETERQIVMMTANRLHRCDYCMAAHSMIAQSSVAPEVIHALRHNTAIADAKLEALRQFTIAMIETRGWQSKEAVAQFLAAGYTQQTVLEVILGTSLKIMSNYTTSVADTALDVVFAEHAWQAAQAG